MSAGERGFLHAHLDELAAAVVAPVAVEHRGDRADRAVHRRAVVREVARARCTAAAAGSPTPTARPTPRARAAVRGARRRGVRSARGRRAPRARGAGARRRVRFEVQRASTSRRGSPPARRRGEQVVEPGAVRASVEVERDALLVGVAVLRGRASRRTAAGLRPGSRRRRGRRGSARRAPRGDR